LLLPLLLLLLQRCIRHAAIRCRHSDGDADRHKRLCSHTQLLLLLLVILLLLLLSVLLLSTYRAADCCCCCLCCS
jgi:cytochrome c biogenesis factor